MGVKVGPSDRVYQRLEIFCGFSEEGDVVFSYRSGTLLETFQVEAILLLYSTRMFV